MEYADAFVTISGGFNQDFRRGWRAIHATLCNTVPEQGRNSLLSTLCSVVPQFLIVFLASYSRLFSTLRIHSKYYSIVLKVTLARAMGIWSRNSSGAHVSSLKERKTVRKRSNLRWKWDVYLLPVLASDRWAIRLNGAPCTARRTRVHEYEGFTSHVATMFWETFCLVIEITTIYSK